jgi:hypothetical protein
MWDWMYSTCIRETCTRWRWMVKFTRPLYPPEDIRLPLDVRPWASERNWTMVSRDRRENTATVESRTVVFIDVARHTVWVSLPLFTIGKFNLNTLLTLWSSSRPKKIINYDLSYLGMVKQILEAARGYGECEQSIILRNIRMKYNLRQGRRFVKALSNRFLSSTHWT